MSSTCASWLGAVRAALEHAGVDADAVLRAAGIDAQPGAIGAVRLPVATTAELWRQAVAATGDPAFGIAVARCGTRERFPALGAALSESASLWDAVRRLERYFIVVSGAVTVVVVRERGQLRWTLRAPAGGPVPPREAVDAVAYMVVRLFRGFRGRSCAPLALSLRREAPADPGPWLRAFRCPVSFGAAADELRFDAEGIEQPRPGVDAVRAYRGDQLVERSLARLARQETSSPVRAALARRLAAGEPEPAAIAADLHMSLRTLQRRLAAEGTSLRALLDTTRRELAVDLLRDRRYSIADIAYLLGFAQPAGFTHACERWYGCPPRELRRRRDRDLEKPGVAAEA